MGLGLASSPRGFGVSGFQGFSEGCCGVGCNTVGREVGQRDCC